MSSTNPVVWLIGGSSPLAKALSEELGSDHSIVTFGRSSLCNRYIDLAAVEEVKHTFRECIKELGIPKAVFYNVSIPSDSTGSFGVNVLQLLCLIFFYY